MNGGKGGCCDGRKEGESRKGRKKDEEGRVEQHPQHRYAISRKGMRDHDLSLFRCKMRLQISIKWSVGWMIGHTWRRRREFDTRKQDHRSVGWSGDGWNGQTNWLKDSEDQLGSRDDGGQNEGGNGSSGNLLRLSVAPRINGWKCPITDSWVNTSSSWFLAKTNKARVETENRKRCTMVNNSQGYRL